MEELLSHFGILLFLSFLFLICFIALYMNSTREEDARMGKVVLAQFSRNARMRIEMMTPGAARFSHLQDCGTGNVGFIRNLYKNTL